MAEGSAQPIFARHPKEGERLLALRSYNILDTEPEEEFNEIAQLAARICEAPVAYVNLVDEHREFAMAAAGADPRTLPISESICVHALIQENYLEIADTRADPRTMHNPNCCGDAAMRFYAGALISSSDGLPLGALCVLDHQPRTLSDLQRTTLKVLARQIMARLDLRLSLAASSTLRQEVDHRVKNSLQSLSAFVNLKSRGVESPDAREVLDSVTQNIQTVSLLHELLYKTDAGAVVDLGRYLTNVVDFLGTIAPEGVSIVIDALPGPLLVSSRQASEVGTLVNEVVSNAFKYAFPDERTGVVRLTLSQPDAGYVHLCCADDGIGLPAEYEAAKGLGMRLIAAIAAHLRGTVRYRAMAVGTQVDLIFPFDPVSNVSPVV